MAHLSANRFVLRRCLFPLFRFCRPSLEPDLCRRKQSGSHPPFRTGNGALLWYMVTPGTLPAIYELKQLSPTHHAILAVVLVCLSAVTGYYISYWIMLALVGVPNMEFLVIIGEPSTTIQTIWAEWFPRLIGLKWLKWSSIGLFLSAGLAFATSKIFLRKQPNAQSA